MKREWSSGQVQHQCTWQLTEQVGSSTYPRLHSWSGVILSGELWLPQLQWPLQPPCPEQVHRGPPQLLFGCFQWGNKATMEKTQEQDPINPIKQGTDPMWYRFARCGVSAAPTQLCSTSVFTGGGCSAMKDPQNCSQPGTSPLGVGQGAGGGLCSGSS